MRTIVKLLIGLLIAACLVQAAAASVNYKVSGTPTVDPSSGDLTPGEKVTLSITMIPGDSDADESDILEFYSDLDDLKWSYNIKVDDVYKFDKPQVSASRNLRISQWLLDYKGDVVLTVDLEGVAPTVTSTQEKTILRFRQVDSDDNVRESSEYTIKRTVVSAQDVQTSLDTAKTRLNTVKASIDEKLAAGADTTAAQAKYDEAKAAINRAAATTDAASASADLATAQTALDEAETLLAQAWAQAVITDTQDTINQIDGVITYFEVNRSMGTDQRVINLKTQRDLAAQALSLANDQMTAKNYEAARIKAEDAYQKANSTLTLATQVRQEVGEGFSFNFGNLPLYIGAGVLIILVIGGVIVLRNRRKWDELG